MRSNDYLIFISISNVSLLQLGLFIYLSLPEEVAPFLHIVYGFPFIDHARYVFSYVTHSNGRSSFAHDYESSVLALNEPAIERVKHFF